MNDIKITTIKRRGRAEEQRLENPTRRNFIRAASLGGALFAVHLALKKVKDVVPQSARATTKQASLNGMTISEDSKEFIIYDKSGNSLLIFEKEV